MRPFAARDIRGTYATLLLPIREDDAIDFDLLSQQLDLLTGSGVEGIYANGTAGEFFSLTEDEFRRIAQLIAETCEKAGLPYQIGAACAEPRGTLERIAMARDYAPSAIQVTLPDWWPPTLEESISFLRKAAEIAAPIPLVLYNPPHAKRVLAPHELAEVCEHVPQVVGIKTGGGGAEWYAAMQPVMSKVSVFVPGHSLATGIVHGAAGSYSNVACLQPQGAARWNRLMYVDRERALEIERSIQQFMSSEILPFRQKQQSSNMALDKLLAWIGNWCVLPTRLRWPYRGVASQNIEHLREVARREIPFLFSNDDAPRPTADPLP